jgi:hypothetical protein
MSISSIGGVVNSVAHAVSHAAESFDSVVQQTPTTVDPQSPSTMSSSMASFVPTGGLHAVAGGQSTATAKALHSAIDDVLKAIGAELNTAIEGGGDTGEGHAFGAGQSLGGNAHVPK